MGHCMAPWRIPRAVVIEATVTATNHVVLQSTLAKLILGISSAIVFGLLRIKYSLCAFGLRRFGEHSSDYRASNVPDIGRSRGTL
jgi:hypothetical protein